MTSFKKAKNEEHPVNSHIKDAVKQQKREEVEEQNRKTLKTIAEKQQKLYTDGNKRRKDAKDKANAEEQIAEKQKHTEKQQKQEARTQFVYTEGDKRQNAANKKANAEKQKLIAPLTNNVQESKRSSLKISDENDKNAAVRKKQREEKDSQKLIKKIQFDKMTRNRFKALGGNDKDDDSANEEAEEEQSQEEQTQREFIEKPNVAPTLKHYGHAAEHENIYNLMEKSQKIANKDLDQNEREFETKGLQRKTNNVLKFDDTNTNKFKTKGLQRVKKSDVDDDMVTNVSRFSKYKQKKNYPDGDLFENKGKPKRKTNYESDI
jgi:hypothetical protein